MVSQKPTTRPPTRTKRRKPLKPLGQQLAEIGRSIPEEAWESFPVDVSKRFDELLESGEYDD